MKALITQIIAYTIDYDSEVPVKRIYDIYSSPTQMTRAIEEGIRRGEFFSFEISYKYIA